MMISSSSVSKSHLISNVLASTAQVPLPSSIQFLEMIDTIKPYIQQTILYALENNIIFKNSNEVQTTINWIREAIVKPEMTPGEKIISTFADVSKSPLGLINSNTL